MEFLDELLRVIAALNRRNVEYVLVGGAALNVHGLIRATEDVDLFVAATIENVDALKRALRDVWDDPDIDTITAADLLGDYPAIAYGPPSGTLSLDILTRLGDFATYADLEQTVVMLRDVPVRVATPRTLHWMKRDTVRALDRADAEMLAEAFDFTPKERK